MGPTRVVVLAAFVSCALGAPAHGFRPRVGLPSPGTTLATQAKMQTAVGNDAVGEMRFSSSIPAGAAASWTQFQNSHGDRWIAQWNQNTAIPGRILGAGIPAPGTVANAQTASTHAHQFLADHLNLLAPGAKVSDFELVANRLSRGMRVIGFVQKHGGHRVIGGQINFRYKNDRLFVIGSDAFPNVSIRTTSRSIAKTSPALAAQRWIGANATATRVNATQEQQVLPIVRDGEPIEYHLVTKVTVNSRAPMGLWDVFVDANTHEPIARIQKLRFAAGQVLYRTPERYPSDPRVDFPAIFANVQIDGVQATTDVLGMVSWPLETAVNLAVSVTGPLVQINNQAGASAATNLVIAPDGTAIWDPEADEITEAQLTAFVHAGIAKEFARELNPELEWLDEQIPVNVNIAENCNAFSDGNSINFFTSSQQCENTARLVDVVYHEFGHSLHAQSIIEGVGQFDGAFSEGLSDFLAASLTNDPAMGRGFFKNDDPLRHIDPPGSEARWPDDIGGVHTTGLIFAGAMWDLRKLLIERYGESEGIQLTNRLYYAAVQRAASIPSTYAELLAEDDDDGNLDNGTPNICDINAAFGPHGLRAIAGQTLPLAQESALAGGYPVQLQITGLQSQCPGDGVSTATLEWRDATDIDRGGQIVMDTEDNTSFAAEIPQQPERSIIEYRVNVTFSDGSSSGFPSNTADPYYQFYVGELVELYCTDFETDAFDNGWTHGLQSGSESVGADDWQWGPPQGAVGSGDPSSAFSGENVIGNDLGAESDGVYKANMRNYSLAPVVEVGNYSDVRLQYWRWLNVEDAFFDSGRIYVNDKVAWTNLNSDMGNDSNNHHRDAEWRFQDVPVSTYIRDGQARIRFELESDGGLEFGGWTIDDFCIVADANSICGDGEISPAETCDDGENNSDTEADACRSNCRVATCGDSVVDTGEQCDDGNGTDGDGCDSDCTDPGFSAAGCGCRTQSSSEFAGGLVLFALFVLLSPRRRREKGRRRQRAF